VKHLLSGGRWLCHEEKRLIQKNDTANELTRFMSHVNGPLPKSRFAWSKTLLIYLRLAPGDVKNLLLGNGLLGSDTLAQEIGRETGIDLNRGLCPFGLY
jgi:hypothetical protein